MEKLRKSHMVRYPLLIPFKEDLEEIVSLFEKNTEKVNITVEDYELQNFSEVDKLGKEKISLFEIQGLQPGPEWASIYLTFESDSARLYLTEKADVRLYGLAAMIEKFLLKKKRKFSNILASSLANSVFMAIGIITFVVNVFIIYGMLKLSTIINILSLLTSLIMLSLFYLSNYIKRKRYTIIYVISLKDKSSFLIRNKDQIILSFINLALGFILGWLSHLLTK